ncbi:MAG: hypothetical protein Fur0044_17600 [Anaerolineae bacterium]
MSRLYRKVSIGIIVFVTILASVGIYFGIMLGLAAYVNTLQEVIAGETPYDKLNTYVQSIIRGDEKAALDLWELPNWPEYPEAEYNSLRERRQQVTDELLGKGITPEFTILSTEWWLTCCEPRPTFYYSSGAGAVRMKVQFHDNQGLSVVYIFHIIAREIPWNDDPRDWVIRGVYPLDQEPLFFGHNSTD